MNQETREFKTYKTIYIAKDGSEFLERQECEMYEKTATCAIKALAKTLTLKHMSYAGDFMDATNFAAYEDGLYFFEPKSIDEITAINTWLTHIAAGYGVLTPDHLNKRLVVNVYCDGEGYNIHTKDDLLKMYTSALDDLFMTADEKNANKN